MSNSTPQKLPYIIINFLGGGVLTSPLFCGTEHSCISSVIFEYPTYKYNKNYNHTHVKVYSVLRTVKEA